MAESDVEEASVDAAAEIVGDRNWPNFRRNHDLDVVDLELGIEIPLKYVSGD